MSQGNGFAARVADDASLRAVLRAARSCGVSLSTFLGAKRVTTHFYGDGGRLVRSETESEWTRDDREAALALMAWEADLCPGCNQPLSETTSPENEERYVARPPLLCHRCVATESAAKKWENHAHPGALLIPIELNET
jgi:hypothetical protein